MLRPETFVAAFTFFGTGTKVEIPLPPNLVPLLPSPSPLILLAQIFTQQDNNRILGLRGADNM